MPAVINQKLKENIIAEYAISNSINSVAQKYDVSWATARKIVQEAESQVNAIREEKQKKYINDAWEVVKVYMEKLMDPKTVKEAKARECAQVVIGMIERIQKQQEINQQFDFMYRNIKDRMFEGIREEMKDTQLGEALNQFFYDQLEKQKDKTKKPYGKKSKVSLCLSLMMN